MSSSGWKLVEAVVETPVLTKDEVATKELPSGVVPVATTHKG
jgi:hypothetical protein